MNHFKFHPVGQGLFYTGQLIGGRYNFVYDCGTENKCSYMSDAIDHFVDKIYTRDDKVPDIDFVVISHLHRDHFSGLPELAQRTKIKRIKDIC